MTAFNPLFTIGNTVIETFKAHLTITKDEAEKLAEDSFIKMNLNNPKEIMKKYPHELSGGMLQRIMIAITIALKPDLIIADEPTTAIDCLNVVEVIKEFKQMKDILNTSMIFISHDLSVLSAISDEIMVMNSGEILEYGSKESIINNSKDDHTKYLIDTRMKLLKKFKDAVK
ncbi:ATP-binding cassette domain-containing protein [Clostridium butyricum]|nr:ATP-binding cassette domain-containing protein [Clostridium butyricum]